MTPFLLVPGLNCDARVYRGAAETLWRSGPVSVANHLEGEGLAAIAANILRDAPPTFALAGFSMGGYPAFEILRQAPERVTKLALLDTSARPDSPEATDLRRRRIEATKAGKFGLDDAKVLALLPEDKPVVLVCNKLDAVHRRAELAPPSSELWTTKLRPLLPGRR